MDLTIEEMSMNAWPSIKTIVYDGWVIRFADGYANRANSIIPLYPSKIKLEEKIKHCDELFARHNLPAAYKLTSLGGAGPSGAGPSVPGPSGPGPSVPGAGEHRPGEQKAGEKAAAAEHRLLEEYLAKLNYRKINETSVQVLDLAAREQADLGQTARGNSGIVVRDHFSEEWIKSVIEFNRIEDIYVPAFKRIIGNIGVEKVVLYKEAEGKIVSCGYGTIERGHVGIFDIVVREEARRKGYGREIVEAILAEGAKRGAEKSYLQVMLSNPAALSLYEKMGYREVYRYWYRKKMEV